MSRGTRALMYYSYFSSDSWDQWRHIYTVWIICFPLDSLWTHYYWETFLCLNIEMFINKSNKFCFVKIIKFFRNWLEKRGIYLFSFILSKCYYLYFFQNAFQQIQSVEYSFDRSSIKIYHLFIWNGSNLTFIYTTLCANKGYS